MFINASSGLALTTKPEALERNGYALHWLVYVTHTMHLILHQSYKINYTQVEDTAMALNP